MSNTIISKGCSTCKQIKVLDKFYKDKSSKGGYSSQCKICKNSSQRMYRKNEKGKANNKRYKQKHKEYYREYMHQYYQSETGKAKNRLCVDKYRTRFPERLKASNAVNNTIRAGILVRPDSLKCICGKQAQQYHHHKGYAPEHRLDVIPVCIVCHCTIYKNKRLPE